MPRELGVLVTSQLGPAEAADLARTCEQAGYGKFWYTDIPFCRDCYVVLAVAAHATTDIMIGPGVTNPFSRHPAVTAAAIATLDEVSGGRALLGLGAGGSGLRPMGMGVRSPLTALRETVDMTRRLLRGERVSAEGKIGTLEDAVLDCTGAPIEVPVYFATHGEQTTRLAGQIADGVLLANILDPDALTFYLDLLAEGRTKAERAPDAVSVNLRFEVCMSDDRAAAMRVMKKRVSSRLLSQYPKWDYLERLRIILPPDFVRLAEQGGDVDPETAMAALPDEVVELTVLVGDPDDVARQVAGLLRPDVDEITIRPHVVAGQQVDDVLKTFADVVMPAAEGTFARTSRR